MMRKLAAFLAVVVCWLSGPGASTAGPVVPADVADDVSLSNYTAYLSSPGFLYTHNGNDRTAPGGANHDQAKANIYATLAGFGLTTSYESGTWDGHAYVNVVAVLPGVVHPDNVYIVGAHYDSVSNPGADDDASGVAGVLELARVLSDYAFEATIKFVAFDSEETGMDGSGGYVATHSAENVLGMVSMDMIAYNPAGANHDKVSVYGRTASDPIKQALAHAVTTWGNGITPVIGGDVPWSDHAPFEAAGDQAALLIEYNWGGNPHYHNSTDSVDTAGYIDYVYATDLTRSVAGWLAAKAAVVPEPATALLAVVGLPVLLAGRRRRRAA